MKWGGHMVNWHPNSLWQFLSEKVNKFTIFTYLLTTVFYSLRSVVIPVGNVDGFSYYYVSFSRINYWLNGPIGFPLAFLGLILNAVALYKLAKQRNNKTFHTLMMFLACWDFGYLFFNQFLYALPVLSKSYKENVFNWILPYLTPMAQICICGSCFTTVALTVER